MNSKQVNETVNRLVSFMGDVKDGNLREILANMQKMCDYQAEKLRIYEEHLTVLSGKERPELTDSDKCRLAQKGKALNDFLLASVEPTWAPGTLRGWYNSLVGAKYDSTKSPNQKKRGRKPISQEIVDEVLKLAQNNPDWGYDRIAGTMRYLGYDVCASTVKHILSDYGIVPDPERRLRGDWDQFIETQQHVTAATDFAQVELMTPYGLVRESLLFFMDIGGREVRCGGIVHAPDSNWTAQVARNMCDMWDGFLLGKKYLIHDRDSLFNKQFDAVFESIGITIKKLPPFTPQMNARMENFIRALKTECLDKMIFSSAAQLRYAVNQYLEYWNHYRPHAGLGGAMVKPYEQDMDGEITEVSFLGGLLHGYRRERRAA
jgi:putative transposase